MAEIGKDALCLPQIFHCPAVVVFAVAVDVNSHGWCVEDKKIAKHNVPAILAHLLITSTMHNSNTLAPIIDNVAVAKFFFFNFESHLII